MGDEWDRFTLFDDGIAPTSNQAPVVDDGEPLFAEEPKPVVEEDETTPAVQGAPPNQAARIQVVTVEAQTSSKTYKVDLQHRTCTCSAPPGEQCFHMKRAFDVHLNGCKGERYAVASAMHKEIRRGDLEAALYWADQMARVSYTYPAFYARQICGEETRNADFMWKCVQRPREWTYRDFVAAVTQSRKKWEHKGAFGLWQAQYTAQQQSEREDKEECPPERALELAKMGIEKDDPVPVMLAMFENWGTLEVAGKRMTDAMVWGAFDALLFEHLAKRVPGIREPHRLLAALPYATKRDNFELRLMFIEALFGGWDESMNEYPHDADKVVPWDNAETLRRYADYVYDAHLFQGKARLRKWLPQLRPGRKSPGNIDMRWSGQMVGVTWRYAAYHQLGDAYAKAPWEAVKIDSWLWDLAMAESQEAEEE